MEKTKYTRPWLYREIAKRGYFNIYDIKEVFRWFSEIIQEIIYFKGQELKEGKSKGAIEVIRISGLFNIYLKEISPHEGWNAIKNERLDIPISYKIVITPSRSLLKLLKDGYLEIEEESEDDLEEDLE